MTEIKTNPDFCIERKKFDGRISISKKSLFDNQVLPLVLPVAKPVFNDKTSKNTSNRQWTCYNNLTTKKKSTKKSPFKKNLSMDEELIVTFGKTLEFDKEGDSIENKKIRKRAYSNDVFNPSKTQTSFLRKRSLNFDSSEIFINEKVKKKLKLDEQNQVDLTSRNHENDIVCNSDIISFTKEKFNFTSKEETQVLVNFAAKINTKFALKEKPQNLLKVDSVDRIQYVENNQDIDFHDLGDELKQIGEIKQVQKLE